MQAQNDKNWQAAKQRAEARGLVNYDKLCVDDIDKPDGTSPDGMKIGVNTAKKSKAQGTYYYTIEDGITTPMIKGTFCLQKWGDETEGLGQFKADIQLSADDVARVREFEFGIRRAVYDTTQTPGTDCNEEELKAAVDISEDFSSSINEQYNRMRAALLLPPTVQASSGHAITAAQPNKRQPRIYWKVDEKEVAQLQRADILTNPEDGEGVPILPFKEMGNKNHFKREMSVQLRPVLVNLRSGVRWEVTSLVIGATVSAAEKVWQQPADLTSTSNSLQVADSAATAGSGGKYVSITSTETGAAPFFFVGGPEWLSVVSNKTSEQSQHTRHSLVLTTGEDSVLCQNLLAMRSNIANALTKLVNPNGTLTLMPKIKTTTKAAKSKSAEELVSLRTALLPEQTKEQQEKWGPSKNRIIRILLHAEPSGHAPATVCYTVTTPPASDEEVRSLMQADPVGLAQEGKLRVVPLSEIGAKAKIFAAVDMSRVDLIEGGLMAVCNMRARYVVALSTGEIGHDQAPDQVEFGSASLRVRSLAPNETVAKIIDTKKRSVEEMGVVQDNSPRTAKLQRVSSPPLLATATPPSPSDDEEPQHEAESCV